MTGLSKKNIIKYLLHYPLVVIFGLFVLGMFVAYVVVPDKEISVWENRYLQLRPKMSVVDVRDGSFMRKYDDYTNDQLPGRDAFIKIKALCEAASLKIENNGIVRGSDSYLFTKDMSSTDTFYKNISIINDFSKGIQNRVTVAVAPNACAILKDRVPKGAPLPDQAEILGRLIADNSLLNGANVVDLYSAILPHGDEYIYYRTDHHWTTLGAYYAYRAVSQSDSPISADKLSMHSVDGFYGTLYAKYKGAFVRPDTITYYDIPIDNYITDDTERQSLYDFDRLSEFDKYGMFMCGNFGLSTIKSGVCTNGKSLIIFKDSYANCLIPFLTYDYENISIVDLRYFGGSVQELVKSGDDADVLFLYNFDFLNEDNHFYKLMK